MEYDCFFLLAFVQNVLWKSQKRFHTFVLCYAGEVGHRKNILMNKYVSLFRHVIILMPQVFDAHEFIVELIRQNPFAYFAIMRESDYSVQLANAQIAKYLSDHKEEFSLSYNGRKHNSLDIYRNYAECAVFEKTL